MVDQIQVILKDQVLVGRGGMDGGLALSSFGGYGGGLGGMAGNGGRSSQGDFALQVSAA